jgi:uncharacterized protein (TIGR02001 family)
LRRLVFLLGLLLTAVEAAAQVSGSVSLLSDNRFRGVSLSDRKPALQGEVAYDSASGLYAGAQASTVRLRGADPGLSAETYAGLVHAFGQRGSFDLGVAGYFYPESAMHGSYNYREVFVGGALDRVQARLHYSDDYFGRDLQALYAEINSSVDLSESLRLVVHLGFLGYRGQYPGPSPSSQWDAKLGLVTELAGLTLELSVVGTDVSSDRCPGTYHACTPGLVLAVSRSF